MKETLEPYFKKMLEVGIKSAEDMAEFIEIQTPGLGKEMIAWGAVSEIVAPLIGIIIFFTMLWLHLKYRNCENYHTGSHMGPPGFPFVLIPASAGLILFFTEVMDVVFPLVAPRLYILEKVASFIK